MKDKFLTSLANTPPMGLRGRSQTDSRWIAVSPLPNTTTTRQRHDNDTTTSAMNTVRTTARLWKYAACLLLAFFVGVGNMWGKVYKTYALTDLTNTDLTYEVTSLSGDDQKLNKGERKVEVPCATASGTLYLSGTGANADRYASISSNGSYDAERQIAMTKGYNSTGIAFTSDDILTEEGKYYIVFSSVNGSTTYDYKINAFKYTLSAACSSSGGGSPDPVDPTITFKDANYTIGGTLDLSTLFTSNSSGAVTYSITDAGTTSATLAADGKTFSATAVGTATVQASQAEVDGSYNAKTATATITVKEAPAAPDYVLIKDDGTLNTTDFVTGGTLETEKSWVVNDVTYTSGVRIASKNSLQFDDNTKFVAYNAKTDATQVDVFVYNTNGSKRYVKVAIIKENADGTLEVVQDTQYELAARTGSSSNYVYGWRKESFNLTGRSTIYVYEPSNGGSIRICQMAVYETGANNAVAPAIGYSVNLNKGRMFAAATTATTFEGLTYSLNGRYQPNNTATATIKTKGTDYISFEIPSGEARQLQVTASGSYNVSKTKGDESSYVKGNQNFNLAEGLWYINPNGSNVTISKLAFATPPTMRTITLEYADGVTTDGSMSVVDGEAATQPADPTWEHHRFDGWYNGATPYDWTTNVTGDITLTAHWTQLYTVTYVAGEATAIGTAPTQEDKAAGETFTVADNTFELAGSDFLTWNDGTTDYAPGATYTVGTANVVLTAKWVAAPDKYTVIFMDGADELGRKTFNVGSKPTDDDITKTKPLNTFAAWQKDAADIALDEASWTSVAKDAEVTLTARWAKAYATTVDFEEEATTGTANNEDYAKSVLDAHYYAISTKTGTTFDNNTTTNNGSYLGLKIKNSGTTISWNVQAGKLVLLKAGIMVANGSLSINGGAAATITGGSKTSGDNFKNHYFYDENEAVYVFETSDAQAEIIKAITITDPFTVTFDVAGGDAIADTKGTPSITLPTPTKGTESFLGWFDAADNKIGDAGDTYTPTEDIGLVAHWEAVSTDARLSAITFSDMSGELKPAFDPEVTSYTYTMPYGTASIPTITGATAVNANAGTPVIDAQATAWDEAARVHGVAQSGDTKNYSVTMKRAPKDGVSIIKATISGGNAIGEVTGLYKKEASAGGLSNYKFNGKGAYIGITLQDAQTFKEGDIINVHTTQAAEQGTIALYEGHGNTVSSFYDYEVKGGLGDNKFSLPADAEGKSTIYVCRTEANTWNGYVDYIEVTRPMNPVLTAIIFDETEVEVTGTTVAATLPNGTDLSTMTVTPTIVWNGAGTAVVTTNSGAWAWGENTYVLTDKDGDATTYTITIDRDALKYAVTFDTDGGNTIEAEEVVADGFLTAAQVPADPTKEDYIFQGWTLDGTPVADLTTVQIDAPKTFVATWAADGAIKLLDGATVNRTNFITDLTAESVTIDEVDYNCVKFSGTVSAVSGIKDKTRLIAYNATTTATKIQLSLYNTSTSARKVQVKGVVEGSTDIIDIAEIELGNKEKLTTAYYDFDNTANRTIYIFIPSSAGDVRFLQVKVIESGAALKMAGESGYSINLNQGRLFGVKSTTHEFEGLTFESQSDYQPTSTTALRLKETSASVTIAAPVTMTVTTGNNKTYYVGNSASSTDNETAFAGESNFNLTAGTWYINAGTSEVQITKLSFSAPKCEEPTITTQPATRLDFGAAGNLTATVVATVADGGTLKYQWYNADDDSEVSGATEATLTTTDEGTYYVIVTNTLADHQDNSIKSDEATLKYRKADDATLSALGYGDPATAITLEDGVYTYRVDLAEGTADVPALTATATMAAYGATVTITDAASFVDYKATSTVLVKAEDGVTTQTYTVNFFVAHAVTALEDVTGNMTWDFSKISGFTGALGATDVVLASVEGMINNGTFESDNLMVNANKMASGKLQASMIKFHTTVDGVIKVKFSDTGASGARGDRYLVVNGKQTDKKSNNTTVVTYYGFVPAGDVVLTVAGGGNMLNFTSVEFTAKAAPDYTRDDSWMAPGELGTVCYPEGLVVAGANMYQMAGTDENGKFVFDEVSALEPGKPYLFEAQSTAIRFYTTDAAPAASAGTSNGMVGTFTDIVIPQASPNMYYFSGTKFYAVTARTTDLDVPANRAYVDLNDPHPAAAPKPGVRRITFNVEGTNTATGVEEVQGNNVQSTKVLIDGHLYILRGEKTYAPTGQLIK